MSIYANKQTIGSLDLLGDITDRPGPSFGEYGDTPTWMSNGQGKYIQGTTLDLALLRDQYEDKFSTVGLAKGMLIAGVTQDSAANGIYQNNVSSDESGSLLDARSRTFTDMMASMFGLSENDIAPYRDTIYTPENMEAEVARRSGFLGAIPTINGARPGEEEIAISGVNRTWGDLAEERGLSLFKQERKVKNVVGWSWADTDRRDSYTLKALFELGQINEEQYEAGQQSDEVRSGLIAGANDRVLLSDSQLKMLDESVFPQAVAEANELNLEPKSFERSQFIYEKASQNTVKALTEQFNGVRSPDEAKNLLAQMSAMAAVVGPDFVDEAIMHVTMRDDSWRETAWDSIIPDDMRAVLEAAGHSHDTFASSNNPYAYRIRATLEAERYVATTAREQLFKKDMHDGWFNWTRRLTDTFRTDFAGDPYALYFALPTVIGGVATMGLSTVGTTSLGRTLAYSAIDGLVAGTAEGYAASQIGISDAFRTGNMLELDYSGVGANMMFYGAAGGIGGGLLGGGIASIGPAGRSLGRTAKHVDETVAATGITGAARKQAAINEIVKREAGIPEIEGASLHTHIENTGLAIRLNRGEVEARDVLTEVLPTLVQRQDGEDVSSVVDDLFSYEVLAENGMSQADAVNLVFGIQRALGPGGQLGSEEFDLIIRGALKASREFAEEGGTDLAGSTASRQARIDASLKANGVEVKKRFVGGSGAEALNPKEVKKLRDLTHKLKHSDIPGQKPITKSEVVALAKLALRLNDEAQLRGVRNLLANSRRLDDTALEWFDEKMGKIIELGQVAREDKFLQDALDVETALSLLANERTIRITKELGTSPTKVMKYIAKYKGLVGDEKAIARLNAEMPDAARAVTKIAEGEGLEILKAIPSSFNVNRFLQESDITDKVRKMQKFRTNLRRKVTKTLDTENIAPEDFAARVESTARGVSEVGEGSRRQKVYENLRRELGLSDADDAFDRLVARIVADLPFAAYGSAMKTEILSKAINRLILKTSPDAVKVGEEGITRGFIRQIFKGSSLGERLEKNIARITLFPITQAKLFRHRNRILRGVSNWITGQHITNRVYGNSTDFMSVEAIVEGASRESLPYVQTAMGIRTKLGRKDYQIFDTEFLHLRQKGNFDNLQLEDISPEVRALYDNADDLLADLRAVQREYTGFMERAMDELADAGYPMPKGQSATRYIPHVIKGNLNPEQIESFMAGFRRMKADQLLNGSAKLDLEVLDGLGWIRLLEGSTTDGKGNKVNKTFSIPADSPFYRSANGAENEEFAKQVIKEGWSGLVRHSKESTSSTSIASAPKLGAAQKIRARQNVDIYNVRREVNEISGTDPNFPLGRSAEEASDAEAVARGIAGTDEIISRLEDQLNELMVSSKAVRQAYFDATGERVEDLMVEIGSMISERRRTLMAHANRELSSGRSKVRRKPMSQNQKIKIINDRELFAAQSSGHAALLNRLDNMIVEGYLDDESARVIMLAFVDVDPHKMLGMSFVRMDATDSKGVYGRAYDTGDGTGLVTLRRQDEIDGSDPVTVASIMVHEISHIAFLSASPRMQAVMQSLFEQVKSGRNREMAELFQEFGMDSPHTFSNVHEFVAALAEITLVQNQAKAAPKRGMLAQLMAHLGKFWKELIGDVAVLSKEGEGIAEGILGKEQFSAVRSAIKNIYDLAPSETPVDNLKRIFDIEEAAQVDKFGGSATKLDDNLIDGIKFKLKKDEYGDPYHEVILDGAPLQIERNTSGVGSENHWSIKNYSKGPETRPMRTAEENMRLDAMGGDSTLSTKAEMTEHVKNLLRSDAIVYDKIALEWRPKKTEAAEAPGITPKRSDEIAKPEPEPPRKKRKSTTERLMEEDAAKEAEAAKAAEAEAPEEEIPVVKAEITEVSEMQSALVSRYLEENPGSETNSTLIDSLTEALGYTDYSNALFRDGGWPVKDDGTRMTEDELYMALKSKVKSRMASKNKQTDRAAISEAGQSRRVSMTDSEGSTIDVAAEARVSFERQLEEDREELAAITQRAAESGDKKIQKQAAELNERMDLAVALMEMGVLNFEIKRDAKNITDVSLLPVIGKMNERLGVTKEQVDAGLKARNIFISDSQLKNLFNKGGKLNAEDLAARRAKLAESLEGVDATRKAQAEANRKAEEIQAARRESDRVASTPEVQNDVAETSAGKDTRPALKAKAEAEAPAPKAEAEAPAPKAEAEAADSWPPVGSFAATDPNASAPYVLNRITDDTVDRAYMFYNQEGEPVFVSHTIDEETLPNGSTETVMYVDFESSTADGEVTSFVNTNSGDPLRVIRAAFSKAEADAEELGVNTVIISRGDVDGDNVQGVKIYKRLVELAYPDKTVYSARANRANPYLAVTLDNTNPLIPSLGSPFPFDQSYYLLTDARLKSILKKTDWPIDLKLKGKDLRKAIDSYLQENHTKLGDDIPTWDNNRRAVVSPAPKAEAPVIPRLEGETDAEFRARTSSGDLDLRTRYEEDAKARLEAEGRTDEDMFAGTEVPETIVGPRPRTDAGDGTPPKIKNVKDMSDDEIFEEIGELEELGVEGLLIKEMADRYNEIRNELADRYGKPRPEPVTGISGGGKPPKAEAEAPAPKTEAEAPAPKAEAGDGTPPKDPPKTAKGAGDEGEKPKPKPKLEGMAARLDEYFERKMKSKITTEAGDFNAKHRLSGQGSLSDLYRRAVTGDLDVLSDGYKNRLRESGRAVMSPVDNVARDYIDNAGGGFKGASIISTGDVDAKIGQLGDINRLTQRTFSQDDFDGPGGEELSRLFAENSSSMEGVIRYAEGALASIRLQKGLDELVGSKGATMNDLLLMVKQSLTENAIADSRSGRKAIGSLTKKQVQEIDSYMEQLKDLYLRARGINPIKDTSFARASRITQNLTYSLLGPKFAMSVAFVESVSGVLRMSGLNPLKIARNTGLIFGALVDMAQGSAARSHPAIARWMAATGLDKKIMAQTVQDLSYELSNLKSTSMAKFGAMNTLEDGDLMMTFMDRLRNHWANLKGAKDASGEGNRIDAFFDGVEAFTAGSADLGGMMSGMLPMTNAVRTVASNQAKSVLFKHLDKLMELSNRMADKNVTLKEVIGMARDVGVPRQTAVYAAEAGLLRSGVLEEFINISGASASTNARKFSLNDLTRQVSEANNRSRQGTVGLEFDEAMSSQKVLRDQVVPSVNKFIMYFTGEMSPELRGTMRFTGTNPLMDLLFQITSYPLAAYQALVKNGVYARGPLMTTGLLMSLVALEANNRHLQNILDPDKDEDARKKSMEWFTTPMTTQKLVETMATQGLASPLFGAVSPYLRDLAGNPMLKSVGSDVKNFPGRPFASPAIGTGQRLYNSVSRAWGHATGGDPASDRAMTSYEKLFKLAKDSLTPLNALPIELGMDAYSAATNNYKAASLAVTEGSERLMPGSVPPSMGDFSYFKWMAADEQPSGFDQIDLPPSNSMPESTPAPQPRASVPAAPAAQPSEGLADLLNRNK